MSQSIVERLKALVALADKVTGGKWTAGGEPSNKLWSDWPNEVLAEFWRGERNNLLFVVALRNSIPDIQHAADEIVRQG